MGRAGSLAVPIPEADGATEMGGGNDRDLPNLGFQAYSLSVPRTPMSPETPSAGNMPDLMKMDEYYLSTSKDVKTSTDCERSVRLLDMAMDEIVALLSSDVFPRFCQTERFKQLFPAQRAPG